MREITIKELKTGDLVINSFGILFLILDTKLIKDKIVVTYVQVLNRERKKGENEIMYFSHYSYSLFTFRGILLRDGNVQPKSMLVAKMIYEVT